MNAIAGAFRKLGETEEKGLVVYLTAGDPDFKSSLSYFRAVADGGADILEVGVPFSDPTADGPTIEAASRRALAGGMSVTRALELVHELRKTHSTPVVLFGYYNPFFRYGQKQLWKDARAAGVDGFLVVDLPYEEAGAAIEETRSEGLCWIPLAAPTSGMERIREFDRAGSGFMYLISITGVTGVKKEFPPEMLSWSKKVKSAVKLPLAVGFGISTPAMAAIAARHADAAIVGSACVKIVEKNGKSSGGPAKLGKFIRSLKSALR
ncbi:MAG: tryptophan synthase subunit alpha [Syntrophorhabdaceae bacterium]|nr:tryptophan synthase subunit alpha [Syntrophorhabdaceae bacterium]